MDAFRELYEHHHPAVYRFALFLTGNPAAAEDLASETFLRALAARPGIRQETVRAYLLTITRNLYLDQVRAQDSSSSSSWTRRPPPTINRASMCAWSTSRSCTASRTPSPCRSWRSSRPPAVCRAGDVVQRNRPCARCQCERGAIPHRARTGAAETDRPRHRERRKAVKVTRDVIYDLLPAYFAGDASSDTRAFVEDFFATDPEFKQMAEQLRTADTLPSASPSGAREKSAFVQLRSRLRLRQSATILGLCGLMAFAMAFMAGFDRRFGSSKPGVILGITFLALSAGHWIAFARAVTGAKGPESSEPDTKGGSHD